MRGKKMKAIIQIASDTTDNWKNANPLLYKGVWAMEDRPDGTRRLKIGDGKKRWQQLDYLDDKWLPGIQERFMLLDNKIAGMSGLFPLGIVDFGKTLNLQDPDDIHSLNTEAIMKTTNASTMSDVVSGAIIINSFDAVEYVWNGQTNLWVNWGSRGSLYESSEEPAAHKLVRYDSKNQLNTQTPADNDNSNAAANTAWTREFFSESIFANRVIGEYHYLAWQPDAFWLAEKRYLPLEYQILPIDLYQDLFDVKWVGNEKNASADWWYKCDEAGNRNINGLFMRVEDARGLFHRAAGQNAIKRAANNTPFDGGEIGRYQSDLSQRIYGAFGSSGISETRHFSAFSSLDGAFYSLVRNGASYTVDFLSANETVLVAFDSGLVTRSGAETKPASVSVFPCISY
jgi:hypothetical protein